MKPRNDDYEIRETKRGRWKIMLWDKKTYRMKRCPNTATFVSKENANSGIRRHKAKTSDITFAAARSQLMASMPFCTKVKMQ